MDTLKIVQFDIHGTNPVNKFTGEEISIDPTCPWVIPNASPFFADENVAGKPPIIVVYDNNGQELVRDRDWFAEEEFMPLSEVTGRPIKCFIRLSDEILETRTAVKINYQSVGAYFIPRNDLEAWLEKIRTGVIPVPFEKVFGVPATLPSMLHSHSIKTEIGDWFELTWFFVYLQGIVSTRDPEVAEDLDDAIQAAFTQLNTVRDQQWARLTSHDKNYNRPHGPTKSSVGRGNVDNFRTATLAEDRAGTSATLFSTPQGAQELLKDYVPDTSEAMRSGILSMSKFSNGTYIPPTITGSFEGLGSMSECMGICVEADGRTVLIQNHFDGRNEGLYFSTLSNYDRASNPPDYRFDYTVYKYEPPVLKNIGVLPNHIVMGSGNDIIMVGKTTKGNPARDDRWFVALTNNSFDPSGHRFIEVNMANVFAQCGNPDVNGEWAGYLYHGRMSVNLLDNWVVLVVDSIPSPTNIYRNQGRMSYWKIPLQALIDGTPATWTVMKLTYQDYDGVQYTNADYWEYARKQITNATVTRWGRYNFSPLAPPQSIGYFGRRILPLFAKKPGVANTFHLNILMYTFLDWTPPGKGLNNSAGITNMVYEINIVTGVMTLTYKPDPITVDYQNNNSVAVIADRNKWIVWYDPLVRYLMPAAVILPKGELLHSATGFGQESTLLNSVIYWRRFRDIASGQNITTKADLLKGSVGTDRLSNINSQVRYRSLQTPIPIGIASHYLAYETQGENFLTYATVVDKAVGPTSPVVVCRNISGPYAIRDQVYNTNYSPVYSRPLTNDVWKTNMTYQEGVVSITGTAAELDSRGIECGNMGLSAAGWSAKHINLTNRLSFPSNAFQAPDKTGTFLTFPKTYSRVLDVAEQTMKYTPTAFYGLPESLKAKIRTLIPSAKRGEYWSFSIFMLQADQGGMFSGLNGAVLYVKYPNVAAASNDTWDAKIFYIRPVIEAPNAAHPGCHLITDFTILGQSVEFKAHWAINTLNQGAITTPQDRGQLNVYRDGNKLTCSMYSGFCCLGGTTYQDLSAFEINLASGVVNNVGATMIVWQWGDAIMNIPRVGRTRVTIGNPDTYDATLSNTNTGDIAVESSGGAAKIFTMQDGKYYASITSYPAVGWSVFFLEEVEMMVNGTMYRMPTGTIDLRDFDPAPQNKTFWVYATLEDQKGRYILSDTKLRQSGKMLHAATITTGPNQILLIDRRQPFLIGDLEFSYTRKGGIIPMSSGFPQDDGNFTFLRAAELLP